MSGAHLSKDFFEVVKAIGESKSKQEEDRIIVHEVAKLKKMMNEKKTLPAPNKKRQKEFLVRLMYVEMLGHDASFGYIKAVELTASTNLLQKRVGYLCCSLVLSPEHEFRFMIINQLQRDLQSSNHLEVCSALMAVCKLVTEEMIPAVQPMIMDLLRHENELVRKKVVMAIHRFHQLSPESITEYGDKLRRTLCDKDPSVMGAALCILHDLAISNPQDYKDLVPSFVSILKQIKEHRLPREYDYHRIPAPWIQIRLLRILALLGQADQQASEGMYEVLHEVMRRADTGINVGYAIIYECVRTVTMIYPNTTLLDAAAASISRFISSDNHNLKYLGVTGLAAIVKDHPRYASEHQLAVIDCLEDPDETLKRKTLDLLYRMTNPVNVEFISEKLTQFLREATDVFLRTELVSRITQSAERYAPSNAWYIQTMTDVFELGGDLVRSEVAHNLLRLIAEGSGEDEDQDMELRRDAVETYLELLDKAVLPDVIVTVMSWVLGEYGYLSQTMQLGEIAERLCELIGRPFQDVDITRAYILSAVIKITAQMGQELPVISQLMEKYSTSRSTDIQQRCFEYKALVKNMSLMSEVLPIDASCEDVEVDPNLEFLQAFVDQAAAQGAPTYNPPEDSDDEDERYRHRSNSDRNALNFQAYEKPELPHPSAKISLNKDPGTSEYNSSRWGPQGSAPAQTSGAWGGPSGYPGGNDAPPQQEYGQGGRRPVKNMWGPSGFNGGENKQEEPPVQQAGPTQGGYPQQQQPSQQQYGYQNSGPQGYGYGQDYQNREEEGGEFDEDDVEPPLDERQRMASALFGGLPGANNAGAPRGQRQPRRSSGRNANPSANANANAGLGRRTSRQTGQRRQSAPEEQRAQPQPSADVDLLDMSFDNPAPVPSGNSAPGLDPFSGAPAPVRNAPTADPFNLNSIAQNVPGYNQGSNIPQFSPLVINTAEFGPRWGTCRCENKFKVQPTSVRSLDEYMGRLRQNQLHPVEAIAKTNEAIGAAKYGNTEIACLIHTKLRSAGYLEVTVRSTDQQAMESLSDLLMQKLR